MRLKKFSLLIGSLWFCLVILMMGLTAGNARAQAADACSPAPAVKAALDALPQQTLTQTDWEFHQQRLAAIQALLRKYPEDWFVQRAYIEAMRSPSERNKVIAEYKARHEQNPDSAQLTCFYARTLLGRQSPEAIKLLDAALEKDPKFPWPHRLLVIIYNSPAFLNKEQGAAHLKAFLDACPACLEGYEQLARMDDKNLMRSYAGKLRAMLQTRSDPDAVGAYRTIWSMEFKAHPPSEYDALRRQVGQDVVRIRHLNLVDKRQWYQALEDGYKLVNDPKQADWAQEERQKRFPQPYELAAMRKLWKKWPGEDAPPATKQAFYKDLLAQTGQWLKERPNLSLLWSYRLMAMENLDDVPAADVESAAEQMLKSAANDAGPEGPHFYDYLNAVRTLAKKHLGPQHVIEWAQKGLAQNQIASQYPPDDLYATKENPIGFSNAYGRLDLVRFKIGGLIDMKQAAKAQTELAQMDRWLQDFKSLAGENHDRLKSYRAHLVEYWGLMARAAELQGHKVDAMAFYQNALMARLEAQQKPEPGQKDELADNAHKLWTTLGGTEDAWQLWYGRPANALATQAPLTWETAQQTLPAFELADLSGKTWTPASFKGKTTFLNFWASW